MKRYIDADKLSEDIRLRYCKDCNNHNEVKCRACWVDDMLGEIEDTPDADVVEVVRCKDCAGAEEHLASPVFYKCNGCNFIRGRLVSKDFWCKCGKRKGGV